MDQLASPSVIISFDATASIGPQQYLLLELSSSKLNNGADGVTLLNQAGAIQDQMQYESSEPGMSWSRKNWDSAVFLLTSPTPGEANRLPSPSPTADPSAQPTASPQPSSTPTSTHHLDLQLTALYPCPDKSESEWIEITNPSDQTADLTNWKLKDEQNNSVALSGSVPTSQPKTIPLSRNILNNAGDSAFLENPAGTTISSLSYRGCTTGEIISANSSEETSASSSATLASTPTITAQHTATTEPTTHATPSAATSLPINLSAIQLTDPTPTPTPRATYITLPPLPPKNAVLGVILGGMLISGGGVSIVPKERLQKLFSL